MNFETLIPGRKKAMEKRIKELEAQLAAVAAELAAFKEKVSLALFHR